MGETTKACPTCGETVQEAAAICRFCQHDFRTGVRGMAPPPPKRTGGGAGAILSVIAAVVVALMIFAVIAAIVIPGILMGGRASTERNASASLKTLITAQADFRSNDRDNDGAGNYWVRDVYGLFALCPSEDGTTVGKPSVGNMIKLIEPSIAAADGGGLGAGPGCVAVADAVGSMSLKASYAFMVFELFEVSPGKAERYAVEGNIPAMGKSYNPGKYGFMTAPEKLSGGRMFFIVNEDNTIWRMAVPSGYAGKYSPGRLTLSGAPIGPAAPFPLSPAGEGWAKLD